MIESVFSSLGLLFFPRLLINCIALYFLIRVCFSQRNTGIGTAFNYYMFGIGIFLVTYSLKTIDISIGFAFGLFAIFSMLRYRTEVIPFKEMTYLFLVTVVSLLCAVSPLSTFELLIVLSIIAGSASLLEAAEANKKIKQQVVRYEKIENIKPENYHLLIEDLRQRTGLNVTKVEITSIDFMQDSAYLTVFYACQGKKSGAAVSPYGIDDSSRKIS